MFAEFKADGILDSETFTQYDIKIFRRLVTVNILNGEINYDNSDVIIVSNL
jgi:hypothetical protein